jgi:hypothetical protein
MIIAQQVVERLCPLLVSKENSWRKKESIRSNYSEYNELSFLEGQVTFGPACIEFDMIQ